MRRRIIALSVAAALTSAAFAGCAKSNAQSSASPLIPTEAVKSAGTGTEEAFAPVDIMYDTAAAAEAYSDTAMCEPFMPYDNSYFNTEEYSSINENGFRSTLTSPLSTFAADVDTASYANLRRMITDGYFFEEIPSGAVRAEEMINYFDYDYNGPEKGEPLGVNFEIASCPWNQDNLLLMVGLQTEAINYAEAPDSNLVFLIDSSGSMNDYDKLPLLKDAFSILIDELDENDTVSIVTYAGSDTVVLEGASGDEKAKIMRAVDRLEASGSTNGGAGITTAYELAEDYFIKGGNNRVILATDGDLNVGLTSESELHDLITEKKDSGVFLSVLGFGTGNYSDTNLETLADDGNGNYSYIDSEKEAYKVLSREFCSNMVTVAKDVKLQLEFNPAYVSSYRQIGYENRAMSDEDFSDDKKDGGEIGAGHSVTVLYEIVPASDKGSESSLKYQKQTLTEDAKDSGEWASLSIRYKAPESDSSELLTYAVTKAALSDKPSENLKFASAVAEFAMVLTDSEYIGDGSLRHLKKMLDDIDLSDEYREEFADLVYMIR